MSDKFKLSPHRNHKKLLALKMKEIHLTEQGTDEALAGAAWIIPEERGYEPFFVSKDYLEKYKPKVGDYYVFCDDGYPSWSPAEMFTSNHEKMSED